MSYLYLGQCKFYEGEIVNYKSRISDSIIERQYKVIEILPQEDGKYYDKENTENYWIQHISDSEKRYLVLPSELSKA